MHSGQFGYKGLYDLTTEVIVCTYNGSAFIVEQLESILKQTKRVTRISIYDDRSSDDTVPRIREFVARRPLDEQYLFTIKINSTNLGYAHNFTNAIVNSTEDVLFLCDQDDLWEPEKVEVFLKLFQQYAPDMVFSDGLLIDRAGQKINRMTVLASYGLTKHRIAHFRENAFDLLIKQNYINGAAAAIRRAAAQKALPLPCEMPHDYWLALWCSLHNGIVATEQTLYRYRQHQGNVIGTGSRNPLYILLGIWRQPTVPRERELRIWTAVSDRIFCLPHRKETEFTRRKLTWLSRLLSAERKSLSRGILILVSALNGNYRKYSPKHAFLRDIVSLIK